ncbi:MAG: alpha/beta fold hydrolase [Rubrobacteraceae bacterium]
MSAGVIEEYVETGDGVRLWTATSRDGPPLVLCHGGPGMWDYLEPVAEAVDDLVTVHRWDQRGGGRSSVSGPHTVERFVADLEALRVHFGYDCWLVGGHSWGATLALHYAFAHPERVVALLYLSGTGVGRAWHQAYHEETDRRLTPEQRRRRDELKARRRDADEEREWRTLNGAPDFADRNRALDLAAMQYASDLLPINYECNAALGAETKTWQEDDLLARCRTLDAPVLVVHGASDPRPAWAVESTVEALPGAELRVLPDAGHMPWIEDSRGFAAVTREFLKRVT